MVVCNEYGPVRMIRRGTVKLIWCYQDNTGELHDLSSAPDEEHNLIALPEYEETAAELKVAMEAWFSKYITPEHDALQYPVNGEGQMNRVEEWHHDKRLFATVNGEEIHCPASQRHQQEIPAQ